MIGKDFFFNSLNLKILVIDKADTNICHWYVSRIYAFDLLIYVYNKVILFVCLVLTSILQKHDKDNSNVQYTAGYYDTKTMTYVISGLRASRSLQAIQMAGVVQYTMRHL